MRPSHFCASVVRYLLYSLEVAQREVPSLSPRAPQGAHGAEQQLLLEPAVWHLTWCDAQELVHCMKYYFVQEEAERNVGD